MGDPSVSLLPVLVGETRQAHWNHLGQHIRLSNPELSQWFDHVEMDVTEAKTYARLA